MADVSLGDIAPRLARARDQEVEYRRRRDAMRRSGLLDRGVVGEEMVRSSRAMVRAFAASAATMRARLQGIR